MFEDINFIAITMQTCMPGSCEFGGHNRASLETLIVQVWTSAVRQSMDGMPGAENLFVSWLTRNRGNVTR